MKTDVQRAGARLPKASLGLFALAVLAILVVTRLPLAPKYLYFFDSVNFALALENFNPLLHQPQPPGYPMFVGLLRLLHFVIPKPEHVLLIAGILTALAAVLLVRQLAVEMFFESSAGYLAATLLLFNPAFWFGGITNQVRLSLALCTCGVALLAWRAIAHPEESRWLYATFAALGLAAGFRPALGALLAPLVLWSWWKSSKSLRKLLLGGVLLVAAAMPWMTATVMAVGGVDPWLGLIWNYSNEQFSGTSALFGAAAPSAAKMAVKALIWNGLGALAWLWAAPFIPVRWREAQWQQRTAFLLVWCLPILLFSAFVHIGDPDQALGSIPVLCIVGAGVLAAFLRRIGSTRVVIPALAVAAVNTCLFFYPPPGPAVASGYGAVAYMDKRTQRLIDSISEVRDGGPVTILHYRGVVSWRQLSYYFPEDYLVYLPASPGDTSWTIRDRKRLAASPTAGVLPQTSRYVLVDPVADAAALEKDGWTQHGTAYYRDFETDAELLVGPHRLVRSAFSK